MYPSEEDLLLHLFTLVPLPSICANQETWMPEELCSALTTPSTLREELEAESLDSPDSQTSTALYSLCPRLPITYNEAAVSWLQGRPQVTTCNSLSIPFPSDSECSTDDTDGNTSTDGTDNTDGSPAEVEADSSHRENHWQQGQARTHLPHKMSSWPHPRLQKCLTWGRCPHKGISNSPLGIGHSRTIQHGFQDHHILLPGPPGPQKELSCFQDHPVQLQTHKSTERTTSPWNFMKAFTTMLYKTIGLAPLTNSVFWTILRLSGL